MTTEERGSMIGNIISVLRFNAATQKKFFSEGETFFSLCFMEDAELRNIERLCGL